MRLVHLPQIPLFEAPSPEASQAERSQCAPAHHHLLRMLLAISWHTLCLQGGSESLFLPCRAGVPETLTLPTGGAPVCLWFGVAVRRRRPLTTALAPGILWGVVPRSCTGPGSPQPRV